MSSTPSSRPTSVTRLSLSHITAQNEANLLGTVHGGVIMTLVDSVAGVVAARHSGGAAVTASMDEMVFLVPVRVGDVVHFSGQVNWTGRSSMEVGVRITADRWDAVRRFDPARSCFGLLARARAKDYRVSCGSPTHGQDRAERACATDDRQGRTIVRFRHFFRTQRVQQLSDRISQAPSPGAARSSRRQPRGPRARRAQFQSQSARRRERTRYRRAAGLPCRCAK